ncbi:hypothetical protein F4778DRAFT_720483 [Xylariomycetidae sp. FL2044]|nr:hypothetical protein F4778DRAFT_720483 [Xylariomycetidae sp. FL2044]
MLIRLSLLCLFDYPILSIVISQTFDIPEPEGCTCPALVFLTRGGTFPYEAISSYGVDTAATEYQMRFVPSSHLWTSRRMQ